MQAALVFVGMWLAMMVAMMLPSTLPMLLLYRRTLLSRRARHPDSLMWTAAAGYFLVWSIFGAAVYVLGMAFARSSMISPAISRAMPLLSGGALILAGTYQLTGWKFACLQHCRNPIVALGHYQRGRSQRESMRAFRLGVHHGAFCTGCCWALMLIQLTLGVMNVTAMVAVAAIIAFEKLIPRGASVARLVGIAAIAGGLIVIAGSF
jgi:predicted metal-binding membrane protein